MFIIYFRLGTGSRRGSVRFQWNPCGSKSVHGACRYTFVSPYCDFDRGAPMLRAITFYGGTYPIKRPYVILWFSVDLWIFWPDQHVWFSPISLRSDATSSNYAVLRSSRFCCRFKLSWCIFHRNFELLSYQSSRGRNKRRVKISQSKLVLKNGGSVKRHISRNVFDPHSFHRKQA